jgi:hypothetical protein
MKRVVLIMAAALALGLSAVGGVSAADHSAPGTPGEANCERQTRAFLAQVGQEVGLPGIGNFARGSDVSVKELQEAIREFCAG